MARQKLHFSESAKLQCQMQGWPFGCNMIQMQIEGHGFYHSFILTKLLDKIPLSTVLYIMQLSYKYATTANKMNLV